MDEEREDVREDPQRERAEVATGGRLLLGWGLIAVSVVLLAAGWWGVSGQPVVAAQLAYLASGGIGGLLAGIVGVGLLVSNDVRRDRERLGRVESALLEVRAMLVAQSEEIKALKAERNGVARAKPARPRKQAPENGSGAAPATELAGQPGHDDA